VQIASRLFKSGVTLSVKDILTYHTIEQISVHATTMSAAKYEQDYARGEKSLTPIESWFFKKNHPNRNYYNQSVLFKLKRKVKILLLQDAFSKIIEHHDGLRLNFDSDKWVLFYNENHLHRNFTIEKHELQTAANSDEQLMEICIAIKNSLKISNGLLLKAALITSGADELLFITAHHLVVDGISWRILLEDLYATYNALEQSEESVLPLKTASLKVWEKELTKFSQSDVLHAEESYWGEVESINFAIPLDSTTSDWRIKNFNKINGSLNIEQTDRLLKEVHRTYNADTLTILNVTLALMLNEWTGLNRFIVEEESHGRHLENIDVSRTVGWFTAMYPVKLELNGNSLVEHIKFIKEQIKDIPHLGIGYGIHKYVLKQENVDDGILTEIRFNYLGQFEKEFNNDLLAYISQPHGSDIDPENLATAKLEFNSMIVDGKFELEINYNKNAHQETTIMWIRDAYLKHLQSILNHITSEPRLHLTPSDFDAVDLKQHELDALFQ
jgi:non-ribosomal peptide synthase protein (TIGR01720 family)